MLYGTVEDAIEVVNRLGSAFSTVRVIVMDPAFPQVISKVRTIYDQLPTSTASGQPGGGGGVYTSKLATALRPLDAVIYVQRNPWALWLGLAGAVALIGGIGYRMGQRRAPR